MFRIAFKMLVGDRAKYLLLVSALSFSVLLMTHQSSVFFGLLRWSTATIRNIQAPLWVVDPLVEQPGEFLPLLQTDLPRVRSVEGVKWAVPLFFSIQQARLEDGAFKSIQLMGLDTTTLIGAPSKMLAGSLEDIWQEGAVIIDEVGVHHFSLGRDRPIAVGDRLDVNDHELRVVGICKVDPSFFGYPYVFTTYDTALQITPSKRKNLAFILAAPENESQIEKVAGDIQNQTGLKAYTQEKFFWSTIHWVFKNTGIPFSFSITIIMGFLVGVAVSGQTFYSFILENLKYLGALKAMGASTSLLCRMLILQAFLVGFIGYGVGVGVSSIFGHLAVGKSSFPFFMPFEILLIPFTAVFLICTFSALLGINRVRKLDAAEVFRG
ncbi:MAG: FtsX-like permease family protein [Rhabdochlamydiaceae bacterium]|nr:FtsX-like permease family protein [Rhabdochlamydiaceae bacterium]